RPQRRGLHAHREREKPHHGPDRGKVGPDPDRWVNASRASPPPSCLGSGPSRERPTPGRALRPFVAKNKRSRVVWGERPRPAGRSAHARVAARTAPRRLRGRGDTPIQRHRAPRPGARLATRRSRRRARHSPRRQTTMKHKTTFFRLALAGLLLPATMSAPARAQQPDLDGAWLGTLEAVAIKLRLVFRFTRQVDG